VSKKVIEQTLAELRAVRQDPSAAPATLDAALGSKHSTIVAAAAEIVADAEMEGLEPALCSAFERFLDSPVKRDPGCRAKTAAVRALYRTGAAATAVFLRGARHVQLEPVWGGSVDTAIELRGTSALGLVRSGYGDAMCELADLLADPEPMVRSAAAQAVAYSERGDVGVPLLRLKALAGDADPRVTSACLTGLLALAPERSLPFVAEFLQRPAAEVREAAMLALGESRLHEALPLLRGAAERAVVDEECGVALLAIALLRCDAAWEHLIALVRDGSATRACAAIDAIATYRADTALRERVLAAVSERDEPRVRAHARAALDLDE
jgi:HEAT repeat protein